MRLMLSVGILGLVVSDPLPAATVYQTRKVFDDAVGLEIIDTYESNLGYRTPLIPISDEMMTSIFGQTRYKSTGYSDHNFVYKTSLFGDSAYCAGCNGSFLLDFTRTSLGTSAGVFGVAFDIVSHLSANPYFALATFGDGSTESFSLAEYGRNGGGFFGLTSPLAIRSIHFGLADGGARRDGLFAIDNLTIASANMPPRLASAVPEPRAWLAMVMGLGLMGSAVRRARRLSPSLA